MASAFSPEAAVPKPSTALICLLEKGKATRSFGKCYNLSNFCVKNYTLLFFLNLEILGALFLLKQNALG